MKAAARTASQASRIQVLQALRFMLVAGREIAEGDQQTKVIGRLVSLSSRQNVALEHPQMPWSAHDNAWIEVRTSFLACESIVGVDGQGLTTDLCTALWALSKLQVTTCSTKKHITEMQSISPSDSIGATEQFPSTCLLLPCFGMLQGPPPAKSRDLRGVSPPPAQTLILRIGTKPPCQGCNHHALQLCRN